MFIGLPTLANERVVASLLSLLVTFIVGFLCDSDSSPAAPNVSDTAGRPPRDEGTVSRGNRVSPTARQTARQPKRAAVRVALPRYGPPDIRIGVCCCCNRPGNRGNTHTPAVPRRRFPRT